MVVVGRSKVTVRLQTVPDMNLLTPAILRVNGDLVAELGLAIGSFCDRSVIYVGLALLDIDILKLFQRYGRATARERDGLLLSSVLF